jgi:hypothetical protein
VKYSIEYFHSRVKEEIESWPVGILADYARIVELLMEFGPHLRMPHSRPLGDGLLSRGLGVPKASGESSIASWSKNAS